MAQLQLNYIFIRFYQLQLQNYSCFQLLAKIDTEFVKQFLRYCPPALVHLLHETKHYSSVSSVDVDFTCCT